MMPYHLRSNTLITALQFHADDDPNDWPCSVTEGPGLREYSVWVDGRRVPIFDGDWLVILMHRSTSQRVILPDEKLQALFWHLP